MLPYGHRIKADYSDFGERDSSASKGRARQQVRKHTKSLENQNLDILIPLFPVVISAGIVLEMDDPECPLSPEEAQAYGLTSVVEIETHLEDQFPTP